MSSADPARERCGKPMKQYSINRPRGYDPAPVCGLPAGHKRKDCLTAEAYQREKLRSRTRRKKRAA